MTQCAQTVSHMRIRPLGGADLPSARRLLCELGYAVSDSELARRLANVAGASNHLVIAAELDNAVIGLLHAFARPALEKPCEVVVQALVVDAKRRGLGVGKALMDAAEAWAAARGMDSVALHTRNARAFYTRLGYHTIATPHFMRKPLAGGGMPS